MAPDPSFVISFKDIDIHEDIETHDQVKAQIEKRFAHLAEEFPETTKFEVTLSPDGPNFSAHGHVTGRATDVASHAEGPQMQEVADRVLDKLERSLRRTHDKKIFKNRREAQKADLKRNG